MQQSASDIFAQYIATENINISVSQLIINLLIALVLSIILEKTYVKIGSSLSNRKLFAKNIPLLTLTTLLIIAIVKSSLALSLGLVGALSIIRFRSAIKEPEELAYLFLSIAIGIGLGANQTALTSVVFILIVAFLWIRHLIDSKDDYQNLYLSIAFKDKSESNLEAVLSILKANTLSVNLRRYETQGKILETSFIIELEKVSALNKIKAEVRKLDKEAKISFVDNKQLA